MSDFAENYHRVPVASEFECPRPVAEFHGGILQDTDVFFGSARSGYYNAARGINIGLPFERSLGRTCFTSERWWEAL